MDDNYFNTLLIREEFENELETNISNPFIGQNSGQLLWSFANQSNVSNDLPSNVNQLFPTNDDSSNDEDIHLNTQQISVEDVNTANVSSIITLNVNPIVTPQSFSGEEEATNGVNNSNKRSNKLEPKTKRKPNIKEKCVSMPSVSSGKDKSSECSKTENKIKTPLKRGKGRPPLQRSPEEKRSKILSTNQMSAKKYRKNKKDEEYELNFKVQQLEQQNINFRKTIGEIESEKTLIIEELLKINNNLNQKNIKEMLENVRK